MVGSTFNWSKCLISATTTTNYQNDFMSLSIILKIIKQNSNDLNTIFYFKEKLGTFFI
jgi:hypothetical protein